MVKRPTKLRLPVLPRGKVLLLIQYRTRSGREKGVKIMAPKQALKKYRKLYLKKLFYWFDKTT